MVSAGPAPLVGTPMVVPVPPVAEVTAVISAWMVSPAPAVPASLQTRKKRRVVLAGNALLLRVAV